MRLLVGIRLAALIIPSVIRRTFQLLFQLADKAELAADLGIGMQALVLGDVQQLLVGSRTHDHGSVAFGFSSVQIAFVQRLHLVGRNVTEQAIRSLRKRRTKTGQRSEHISVERMFLPGEGIGANLHDAIQSAPAATGQQSPDAVLLGGQSTGPDLPFVLLQPGGQISRQ